MLQRFLDITRLSLTINEGCISSEYNIFNFSGVFVHSEFGFASYQIFVRRFLLLLHGSDFSRFRTNQSVALGHVVRRLSRKFFFP